MQVFTGNDGVAATRIEVISTGLLAHVQWTQLQVQHLLHQPFWWKHACSITAW
jgi:hypothetical protein